MQSALGPGDEVVTIGGLHATVVDVADDVVTVEISPGVNARYARPAIAKVVKQTPADDIVADDEPVAIDPVAEPGATTPIESPVVETRKTKD